MRKKNFKSELLKKKLKNWKISLEKFFDEYGKIYKKAGYV